MVSFSVVLKQLREEKNLSQKDIADYLGVTRQAIASYEAANREPNFLILLKLADYFNVSVDYLLGRANNKDANAVIIGKNIEIIRNNLSYKEFCEEISKKTNLMIFPELLEQYEKGTRIPNAGTIKILSIYASVDEHFFHIRNTYETYQKERELYKTEIIQKRMNEEACKIDSDLKCFEMGLKEWIIDEDNVNYIRLSKEIKDAGLTVEMVKPIVDVFKNNKVLS